LLDRVGSFPSAVELYREQWSDSSADLPAKLQAAFDATADLVDPATVKVMDLEADPAESPIITDVQKPASTPREDPSKPAPAEREELILAKASLNRERLADDFVNLFKRRTSVTLTRGDFRLMPGGSSISGG
jgi:hypothetical protein